MLRNTRMVVSHSDCPTARESLVFSLVTHLTQASAFFMASICLLLCSTGEPGSPLVLGAATLGRLCVDVCFTTIYVGLAQIFSSQSSKMALTVCETTARLGGIVAPLSGTWPTSVARWHVVR